ncbi:16936_t:CDS:2, partial [Gigaspora rosea]
ELQGGDIKQIFKFKWSKYVNCHNFDVKIQIMIKKRDLEKTSY